MAQDQPNIVLVMADDQGLGDMGYMGHPNLLTPHFDAAAGQGIRFDAFYAAAQVKLVKLLQKVETRLLLLLLVR